jgi:hypothetical protein
MSRSLVFRNGVKNNDFVVFNPLSIELKNEDLVLRDIKLFKSTFWSGIKSKVWSSNCRFFFVINKDHIICGNTHDDDAILCNLTMKVFDLFLNKNNE